MGGKNNIDWQAIGPPGEFQTDLSTQELLTQINEEIKPELSISDIDPHLLSIPQIFKKYPKKETVRIRISKDLYNKISAIQKQTNSRLSFSEFLDILFSQIFK